MSDGPLPPLRAMTDAEIVEDFIRKLTRAFNGTSATPSSEDEEWDEDDDDLDDDFDDEEMSEEQDREFDAWLGKLVDDTKAKLRACENSKGIDW